MVDFILYKLCFGLWSFMYWVSTLFYVPVHFFGVRCGKINKKRIFSKERGGKK